MKSRRFVPGSQSGQGTLEYILVLMVTVILILTVIYQFNDAFRIYAQQFFDGYVACLLETGELPGRGGECQAEMKQFAIKDGKPILNGPLGNGSGGDGSGGSGSGGSGSTGSSGSGSEGKDGKDANQANKGSSGSSGGGKESGQASGGGSGSGNFASVGSIGNSKKGREKSTPVKQGPSEGDGGGGKESLIGAMPGMNGRNGGTESGRAKKTALDRGFDYWGQEREQQVAEAKAPVPQGAKKNDSGDSLRSKVSRVEPKRTTASVGDSDESGFSFGYLLRFILIAGIILAIVVFIGGQLMQIAKSYEK